MTVFENTRYRLELTPNGRGATLTSPDGEHWATLSLLAAFDTEAGTDETPSIEPPRVDGNVVDVARRSTLWERAGVTLDCRDDELEVRAWVSGRGALTDVHLLGGRLLAPGAPTGFFPSGSSFQTLFSPNPGDPGKLVRPATEPAVIGVSGDGALGRGHWFFTPAPLWLGLTTDEEEWLGFGLAAPVDELRFVQLEYRPGDRAFHLVLDYEGHTAVDGEFRAPALVLTPGIPEPYAGLRRHRGDLVARRAAPPPTARETPAWWREPIFCGWGAQCHLGATEHRRAADFAAQEHYDAFLSALEAHEVVPGIVVIDDKWQGAYGTNEPDPAKWPHLGSWITDRHERGQRVLLWWKAWDCEGLPDDFCIRNADGAPIAFDPTNPRACDALQASIVRMLSPEGLDADGLKVDFTARTPSGRALRTHGEGWGIALLHMLLSAVYEAAKDAKPDALIITHTPHPGFADVTDMIRLNDMLRMDDPGPMPPVIPQMRYRAQIVDAACPELLIDTDDWCVPDKQTWREFLELKSQLGVPSLYYATHLDATGEELDADDYAALRRVWERWRAEQGAERVA